MTEPHSASVTAEVVPNTPPPLLFAILAVAVGALVANLYYAQPLIALIAPEIGIRLDLAGALVSVTQIGYAIGLFFLVSLADLVENKRLVLIALGGTVLALAGVALSGAAVPFLIASFAIGIFSTGAQVLVPFAAQLVPLARRGRVVGNVMAGLLTGILLARPLSLFISASFGWRSVFWSSAVLMLGIAALLWRMMPTYQPKSGLSYGKILKSMVGLVRDTPVLRRRATYQALMFAAFNMFWTTAPLMLAQKFGLGQQGIALFALAGVGGALAAPLAGRLADRGLIRVATGSAMAMMTLAFLATGWAAAAGALIVLAILGIILDAAVQVNQVTSQRVIFALAGEIRGRLNAIYMTTTFFGGAIGSILGTTTYHWGGWGATAIAGALIGGLALAVFATELRRS